jgi:hypothetical protein
MIDVQDIMPLADLGTMSQDQLDDYYANIGECLENGTLSEEDAANLIFGPDDF